MISPQTLALRLLIAFAFGAVIGVEREWRQKQAGLKTMALVTVGSAAFAAMSDTFGPSNHNPAQMAAAVIGGIGFLGAGVIMHRGVTVQGLTTAATLWAAASVGVAAGLGHSTLAVMLTVAIVLIQIVGRGIERRIRRLRHATGLPGRFELRVECDADSLVAVNDSWKPLGPELRRSVQRSLERIIVRVVLRASGTVDLSAMEERLIAIEGVRRVDVRHLGVEDE